jgi:DNA-binding CsgD family transcriptional regulator
MGVALDRERDALVGRDRELEQIESFLDAGRGVARVLVLEGDAGIGKTTLWRAGLYAARARGYRVLACGAAEAETQLAFTTLRDLLDAVFDEFADALPKPQRRALAVALLREEPGATPPEPSLIAVASLSALGRLAAGGDTLVAVDDVQWLDAASASPLAYALRRLRFEPLTVLLARRSGAATDTLGLERLGPDLARIVDVPPLTVGALGQVVRTRLGTVYPRPGLRRLHEVSGGNPFYALEIVRELRRRETMLRPGEPLPVPSSLTRLLEERLARLSRAARLCLLAVAAGARTREETVVAAVGGEAHEAIAEAVAAELLVREASELRFSHPLLRATIYNVVSHTDRHHVHARLAEVVADAEERARHLALSVDGPDAAIAAALEAAAAAATARGAHAVAAELAERAARTTPDDDPDALWRRWTTAAEQHYWSGDYAAERVAIQRALAFASVGEQRARSLFALGKLEDTQRSTALGIAIYRRALAERGVGGRWRAEIASALAYAVWTEGSLDEAIDAARSALAFAERSGDRTLLSKVLARVALFETHRGTDSGDLMTRALELEREQIAAGAQLPWNRVASVHHAEQLVELGRFAAARAILEEMCAECRAHEVQRLTWAAGTLAAAAQRAGDWSAALASATEAVELAEDVGDSGIDYFRAIKAHAHAARGETECARAELGGLSRHTQDDIALRRAAGFLELTLGNAEGAHALLSGVDRARLTPSRLAEALPDQIEASVLAGELGRAATELAELEALAGKLDRPLVRACTARCRGLVAHASGDHTGALEALIEALRLHDQVDQPFERARTLVALGAVRRRGLQRRLARETLEEALRILEGLSAAPWAQRARSELARIGGRAVAAGDELSETERRIAELVVSGRRNREVAAELCLSPNTVAWNLSKIYRKVGVGSRTELAARMAAHE